MNTGIITVYRPPNCTTEAFNDYFCSIGQKTSLALSDSSKDFHHYLKAAVSSSSSTDPVEITIIVKKFANESSSGLDESSDNVFKEVIDVVRVPLSLVPPLLRVFFKTLMKLRSCNPLRCGVGGGCQRSMGDFAIFCSCRHHGRLLGVSSQVQRLVILTCHFIESTSPTNACKSANSL